mgnify:CR=1 FL=1
MWRKCGGVRGISICSLFVLIVDGIWWMVDGLLVEVHVGLLSTVCFGC